MFYSAVVLCFCVVVGQLDASAIPMWEYLSKQEKMSFLYSMFANQVESFCESSTMSNCNYDLLKYGLNQLKNMPEEFLDSMDPYQRGANSIIWDSLMAGHPLANAAPQPRSTTTVKPNSYDDDRDGDLDFGSETAASAKIDNVYRVPPPKGFIVQYESGKPEYTAYSPNVATYLNAYNTYETYDKKGVYNRFQEQHTTTTENYEIPEAPYFEEVPLTGPMVVRVHPDGTPVKDDVPLPQDEDLRQYKMSKVQIPNF